MTGLTLKLIACAAMFIDHLTIMLRRIGVIENPGLLMTLRGIGRLAFPIYGFLLAEGSKHTKNKWKYLIRILIAALISEIPFDLALQGTWMDPSYQNVFFTLFLGLICIYVIQWGGKQLGKMQFPGFLISIITVFISAYLAENVIHSDYGRAGVYMIAIMGLYASPLYQLRNRMMGQEEVLRLLFCGVGIMICTLFTTEIEYFGLMALLPIYYYNGQKGYAGKALQTGFYLYYPAHLLIIFFIGGLLSLMF